MDIATKAVGRYTTTVQIPISLRKEIEAAGMTINGALISGWKAMQERKQVNEELREVMANMNRYRGAMLRLNDRVKELEGKNGA